MLRPAAHCATPPAGHREPMARALRERLLRGDQCSVVKVAEGSRLDGRTSQLIDLNLPFEMTVAIS